MKIQNQNNIEKQKQFQFNEIKISSKFQSGNAYKVNRKQNFNFQIWISPDPKSTYCSWFYFTVENIPNNTLVSFTIMNFSNQLKLFKQGHLPVFKTQNKNIWNRIPILIPLNAIIKTQNGFEVNFKHYFNDESKHYFAFTFPWTNEDNSKFVSQIILKDSKRHFIDDSQLGKSLKMRSQRIITITANDTQSKQLKIVQIPNLHYKSYAFKGKKGIYISARVHPGQVASSFILNGFIKWLLSGLKEPEILLKYCVFYIVPIINPDGVSEGNFRNDSLGNNLNRYYLNPKLQQQPEIYSIKNFLSHMIKQKLIEFCLDIHAHVNKQGAFIYGNSVNQLKKQLDVCLFAKILSYNCQFFDYDSCNFTQKNMNSKDKGQQLSKQGASRVAIYKQTGLHTCWTLEVNYHSCKLQFIIPKPTAQDNSKSVSDILIKQNHSPQVKNIPYFFAIESFQQIGRNIGESILDYYHLREVSPIFATKLKSLSNFKLSLSVSLLRMIPFKFDTETRKILNNINSGYNNIQTMSKLSMLICQNNQMKSYKNMPKELISKNLLQSQVKIQSYKYIERQNQPRNLSSVRQININKRQTSKNKQKKATSILKMGLNDKKKT